MAIVAAAMLAGTALSAWGKYQSSQSEASMMHEKAIALEVQAREEIFRMEINNRETMKDSQRTMGFQSTAIAGSGIGAGGAELSIMEDTAARLATNIANNEYVAYYNQSIAQSEAAGLRSGAEEIRKAGILSAFGTGLRGGASVAKNYRKAPKDVTTQKGYNLNTTSTPRGTTKQSSNTILVGGGGV